MSANSKENKLKHGVKEPVGENIDLSEVSDAANRVIHGAEDFLVSASAEAIPVEERVAVTKEDLRPPEVFRDGDELIILTCNIKDIRDGAEGSLGSLYPEQAEQFRESIEDFMTKLYEGLTEDEKNKLDVLVVAGDTKLVTPGEGGLKSDQQRAVLTGEEIITAVKGMMIKNGVDTSSHLIADGDKPVAITHLRDVNMLHQTDQPNVKQFLDYMLEKYGPGRELWMAFEDDTEKEIRESLGVEGPDEIAERMSQLINLCGHMADLTKQGDPSRRVVVFAVGHYDNISPWVKREIVGINPADGFVPVEKGGGLVIKRSLDGDAKTTLGGKEYSIKIEVN